jgi:hypothetical protein
VGAPSSTPRRLGALLAALLVAAATPAGAWPIELSRLLGRDPLRLVPRSLAYQLSEREDLLVERSQRLPPTLTRALAVDLSLGRLSPATLQEISAEMDAVVGLLRGRQVSEGLVRLGALQRIPADLSDPVLQAGAAGYPPGVADEYYALVAARLDRIPVVLEDPAALELQRSELAGYWSRMLARSRPHAGVIRNELFRNGRVVNHAGIDLRNPVFGVASMSYSRAVTAIAATWLAVWREAGGDLTRQPVPRVVEPRTEGGGAPAPRGGR